MPVIHVVIPFLDEDSTLETVVDRLEACRWPAGWSCRLVLVDYLATPGLASVLRLIGVLLLWRRRDVSGRRR